ncbi:phosphotransferase [Spongiactinospora sp. 9N601]|uniref:phosphotransferase n=1 Tax=Spongiactinospora sp. 9N601 TaxID=3375149 RepID=UPI00379E4D18
MTRFQWEDLPQAVRDAIQDHAGPVVKAETAATGLMPGVAARLYLGNGGSVFLKACPADHPAATLYERELWAGHVLPAAVPTPRLRWSSTEHGWIAMLHTFIDGRAVDLSPGSPDVPAMLGLVAELGSYLTPYPGDDAPPVSGNASALLAKGRHLLDRGTLPDQARYVAALDKWDVASLEGTTLLHYDLHTGNLKVVGDQVFVLDWGFACQGAAWGEPAMLAPRLIEAGHTPERVEELLMNLLPAWRSAPSDGVTGLVALWTLFRVYKAMHGPAEMREFRGRAAAAGHAWLRYRLG